ncbi:MAG: dihydrolipoyl dehydrogenase [Syntrophales bacterium]|nr:dihydrolipoyl dehydrogenase [Syntrophales bacterium]
MNDTYDLIVIGGGPGGHALAEDAAHYGAKVCIMENNGWGGTCTHRGCIPTKALLACSKKFADLKKLKRMGISVSEAAFDFAAMKRHQVQMTRVSALGVEKSLKDAAVEMKNGTGTIVAPGQVHWQPAGGDIQPLLSRHICIAWGSEPQVLPNMQTSDRVVTSDGFLALTTLPKKVIIVGGSVIGVEFATFLAEMGTEVTVVEILETILPLEDQDASDLLKQELSRLGVVIHTGTTVKEVAETHDAVRVRAEKADVPLELAGDCVLLCTGRRPRLFPEQLQNLGIEYDRKGIHITPHLETNIANIYAVGDVTGGAMLAHRAMQQGRALASRLFGDGSIICREEAVPSVTYSHPQIARVGLTERQAKAMSMEIEIVRNDYGANIMARTELAGQGSAKLLFQNDILIGATVVGEEACELIAPLSLAVGEKTERKTLSNWIIPHPTLSELLRL